MTLAQGMSNEDLARLCTIETEKFNRRQSSDAQFCFELFRRALADGVSEAFTLVYRVYERQVQNWVLRHPQFVLAHEPAEYFASQAWSRFFFAVRGAKFANFVALPYILSYLQQCAFTAVTMHLREQQRSQALSLEAQGSLARHDQIEQRILAEELMQRIAELLPDVRDQLLARCVFVERLKPREIVRDFPGRWKDERAVSVDLYRIRRILRNDPGLR